MPTPHNPCCRAARLAQTRRGYSRCTSTAPIADGDRGRARLHVSLDLAKGRSRRHQCQHRHLCWRPAGPRPARRPEPSRRHQQRQHRTGAGQRCSAQAHTSQAAIRIVPRWLRGPYRSGCSCLHVFRGKPPASEAFGFEPAPHHSSFVRARQAWEISRADGRSHRE